MCSCQFQLAERPHHYWHQFLDQRQPRCSLESECYQAEDYVSRLHYIRYPSEAYVSERCSYNHWHPGVYCGVGVRRDTVDCQCAGPSYNQLRSLCELSDAGCPRLLHSHPVPQHSISQEEAGDLVLLERRSKLHVQRVVTSDYQSLSYAASCGSKLDPDWETNRSNGSNLLLPVQRPRLRSESLNTDR